MQRGSFLVTADALEGEERRIPWAGDQQEHVRGFCSQHCGVAVTAAASKGKQKCDFFKCLPSREKRIIAQLREGLFKPIPTAYIFFSPIMAAL